MEAAVLCRFLFGVGIDIDDPNNGVWLEGPGGSPDRDGRATHGGQNGPVHREDHLNYVAQELEDAARDGGRDEVIVTLNRIRDDLLAGTVNTVD